MNLINEMLSSDEIILLDGAMGTMLFAAGLASGNPPEEWNILYPDRVRAVHRAYIEAGSRLVLTNTFGANRYRLALHNLQDQVAELNRAAASLLRLEADASPRPIIVAGSMGPTGSILEPYGELSFEDAKAAFAEQAGALTEGGVDILWIETMSDLNEVQAAYEGARSASNLPISATMSFDTHGRTMMGVTPKKAIETLSNLDLMVMGANCGSGPQELEAIIKEMHDLKPQAILVAKANAGRPSLVKGQMVYDGSPEVMADYALRVRNSGARLIGACCGSTPEHIRSMAKALNLSYPSAG